MDYCAEQLLNQERVKAHVARMGGEEIRQIKTLCRDYLRFRAEVAAFQAHWFTSLCNAACYQAQRSACCSKDGIITFFADLVVNAVASTSEELASLIACLHEPRRDMKCLYLGPEGCRWVVKPLVCEMFVCDRAQEEVLDASGEAAGLWAEMKQRALLFRWPDRPVLFDQIESRFMAAGVSSSLMYLHNSPGLIRIKKKAGLL